MMLNLQQQSFLISDYIQGAEIDQAVTSLLDIEGSPQIYNNPLLVIILRALFIFAKMEPNHTSVMVKQIMDSLSKLFVF